MVKESLKRKMFFILGLVMIFAVCRCQISYDPFERYDSIMKNKRANYSTSLKTAEVNDFLRLWPKYKELGFDKELYVPYLTVLPDSALNWKQRMWFHYNYWDANRFFYVQQRLNYLLQVLKMRRDAKATIDLCADMEDEVAEQMIELQRRRLDSADITSSELLLVSAKEKELTELFK